MTLEEVQSLVRSQAAGSLEATKGHRLQLEQALIPPQRITVVWRDVRDGTDEFFGAWLVGQEHLAGGYKIIMREDGAQFGLALSCLPNENLSLVGWYGDSLLSASLAM